MCELLSSLNCGSLIHFGLAVTLGAGVQWIEAYRAVHEAGRAIVGGASAGGTVGAASGWVLGGGHSALSPAHGLGANTPFILSLSYSRDSRRR